MKDAVPLYEMPSFREKCKSVAAPTYVVIIVTETKIYILLVSSDSRQYEVDDVNSRRE